MKTELINQIAVRIAPNHWHRDSDNIEYFDAKAFAHALAASPEFLSAMLPDGVEAEYWEWRFCDFCNDKNGVWTEWQKVEPRNAYLDTVADRVAEFQDYINNGYKYELRKLYPASAIISATAPLQAKVKLLTDALEYYACDLGHDGDWAREAIANVRGK